MSSEKDFHLHQGEPTPRNWGVRQSYRDWKLLLAGIYCKSPWWIYPRWIVSQFLLESDESTDHFLWGLIPVIYANAKAMRICSSAVRVPRISYETAFQGGFLFRSPLLKSESDCLQHTWAPSQSQLLFSIRYNTQRSSPRPASCFTRSFRSSPSPPFYLEGGLLCLFLCLTQQRRESSHCHPFTTTFLLKDPSPFLWYPTSLFQNPDPCWW